MTEIAPSADAIVAEDTAGVRDRIGDSLDRLAGGRLLISGGAGFLGYYMTLTILAWNREVDPAQRIRLTVWDNFARGKPAWLESIRDEPEIELEQRDVTSPVSADDFAFDYVVHAAGIASPTFYRQFPLETMDANVIGLRILLELCRSRGDRGDPIKGFLFFSSSEIYGDPVPDAIPTPEEYRGNVSCTGPRACYDESKRFGETLCVSFARTYDVPVTIVRPFNNYGPGLRLGDRRVIPDFARDVLAGRDIVMLSDGSPTRTFCYVADAVCGYYAALARGGRGESYNIGVEEPEISMADLAERIVATGRELFGYTGKVVRQASDEADYLIDNPNRRAPRITKARNELGYQPAVTLDDGLRRSLIWYADNREADGA